MHSWRVLILPYLGQEEVFKQYDFREPWNSAKNAALCSACAPLYRCPAAGTPAAASTMTNYVAVVGPGTAWSSKAGDGNSDGDRRILLVELANSEINWMEPVDLTLDVALRGVNSKNGRGISSRHHGGANVCFSDRSVEFLPTGFFRKEAVLGNAPPRHGQDKATLPKTEKDDETNR